MYFNVSYQYSGLYGLWRTDGTSQGTEAILPVRASALAAVGPDLYFLSDGLWKTDGTTLGTELIQVFNGCPGNSRVGLGPIVEAGGKLFFPASDAQEGWALWTSDGTAPGTYLVHDVSDDYYSEIVGLTPASGRVIYFRHDLPPNDGELWSSDGSGPGTQLIKDFDSYGAVASTGAYAFFIGSDSSSGGLWRTDGTVPGTIFLKSGVYTGPYAVGSRVYFSYDDGIHGMELWTSDGTVGGTQLLLDRNPAGNSDAWAFEGFQGLTYFLVRIDFNSPTELWRSDGTPQGTALVATLGNGLNSAELEASGSTLFIAFPYENQIWKSDGTTPGTQLVSSPEVTPPTNDRISQLRAVPSGIVFTYDDGVHGTEIWKSDGTPAGTTLARDLNPENISAEPYQLANFNGTLLLAADDGIHGRELWRSGGHAYDTLFVKDLLTYPNSSTYPQSFATLGNFALFGAYGPSPGFGHNLWRTDGTESGTMLVKDFSDLQPYGDAQGMTTFDGRVVFTVWNNGIWSSDGTEPGTIVLAPDVTAYLPYFVPFESVLYFLGYQEGQYGLWKSDGSEQGTVLVAPLNVAQGNDYPRNLTASGALLYFNVCEGPFDCALWTSDGTTPGTGLFRNTPGGQMTDVNGVLFFADYAVGGAQLWKTDGTPGGTGQLTFGDGPWPYGPSPHELRKVGDRLFFTMSDCEHGAELWKSDGTIGGTGPIRDIWPGPQGSRPRTIVAVGDSAVFWATDAEHGEALWKSDGTEEGTMLFQDIEPGPNSAAPYTPSAIVAGGRVYFTATDLTYGTELWSIDTRMITGLAISPTSGPAAGGTVVAVSGTYPDGTAVDIGGIAGDDVTIGSPSYLTAVSPALAPGTLNDVVLSGPAGATLVTLPGAWFADFLDVAAEHPFHDDIESIVRTGITAGCGSGNYCPSNPVTRAQMAVFLLKAEHGGAYVPPACSGVFSDTPCPGTFTDWIEQLAAEGVTSGCGVGVYCPGNPVTRAQMAVFLLKTKDGSSYVPPTATGVFGDVPVGSFGADWIEEVYARGITGGCHASPLLYCPNNANTRGQMAVFLARTFGF